jgi:hypothetical protein
MAGKKFAVFVARTLISNAKIANYLKSNLELLIDG